MPILRCFQKGYHKKTFWVDLPGGITNFKIDRQLICFCEKRFESVRYAVIRSHLPGVYGLSFPPSAITQQLQQW